MSTYHLVRSAHPERDSVQALGTRVAALEAALGDRVREMARLKADLGAFRLRYRQVVGLLHDELDELEEAIAEAELGELARQARFGPKRNPPSDSRPILESAPRDATDAVRRLFRDVAKAVHPDRARDGITRDRRHALMIEANKAYALGDEARLRSILHAWENSPEAIDGSEPDAVRTRLVRRIAEIETQLDVCSQDLAALLDSPLGRLKAMVDAAEARGEDLVRDMVRRLKRDIMVARNRLDAIQSRR